MSFVDDILSALGIGGGSLKHIQDMARSVKPQEIAPMAEVFVQGREAFNTGHTQMESAIDGVVTGWKGDAARAASTTVLKSAMSSRTRAEASTSAADNVRQYAAEVTSAREKVLAVQPVDTSFSTAVNKAGGPSALLLNPGAVAANMASAQVQSAQHREQAAHYLNQMNTSGEQFAAQQQHVYPAATPSSSYDRGLPARLSVQPIGAGSSGGAMPGVQGPSGASPWAPPATTGGGPGPVSTIHHPSGATSGTNQSPGSGTNPGDGGPVHVPAPPPGSTTTLQGANPPGSATPGGPPAALPGTGGAGSGVGAGTIAAVGGGVAAVAAGSLSGFGRGSAALAGGGRGGADGFGERAGSGAAGEAGAGERGFGRGFATTDGGEDPGARLRGGLGRGTGLGGYDPAEESALRSGRMSAAAGELAAGERGTMMPGMGAGAGRRGDEEELNKRPDYLVETDDVWGDGRLAAPPVLG